MSDVYQIVTEKGVKEDNTEIVQILQGVANGRLENDLRLLNYFQEVPVSYPGTVEDVEDDMATIRVHQNQAVVMNHQKMTFLKSRHFPHDVVAKVFRADIARSMSVLSKFAYAQIRAERRQFVRVKLDGTIPVSFLCEAGELKGRMVDISISGMCISAGPADYLETQTNGVLTVALENPPLQIPAMLLKQIVEEGVTKYAFEFRMDSKMENKVSQFIFQRQLEVIRELKDAI